MFGELGTCAEGGTHCGLRDPRSSLTGAETFISLHGYRIRPSGDLLQELNRFQLRSFNLSGQAHGRFHQVASAFFLSLLLSPTRLSLISRSFGTVSSVGLT